MRPSTRASVVGIASTTRCHPAISSPIEGEYVEVSRPRRLVFTWTVGDTDRLPDLVTVLFESDEETTTVVVLHERIEIPEVLDQHELGWDGCLSGLEAYLASAV